MDFKRRQYKKNNTLKYLFIILLLVGCHTAKNVQTVRINTDSIVTHLSDSISHNVQNTYDKKLKEILDNQSSSVRFITDTIPFPTGCDSIDLIRWKQIAESLQSKITIDKNGLTTYQGRIASYQQQLSHSDKEADSLMSEIDQWRYVHQEDSTKLSVKEIATVRTVERTVIPWWLWFLIIIGAGGGYFLHSKVKNG